MAKWKAMVIDDQDDLPHNSIEDPKPLALDSIARRTAGSELTVEVRRMLNRNLNTGWSDPNDDSCRVQDTLRA
jgi:hypothetical protein